jgi:hypothetical protein
LATYDFSEDGAGTARERVIKRPKMSVGFKRKDAIVKDDRAKSSKE